MMYPQESPIEARRALVITNSEPELWTQSLTGYQVDAAGDDHQIARLLRSQPYDFIVLDANAVGSSLAHAALALRMRFPHVPLGISPESQLPQTSGDFVPIYNADAWLARRSISDEYGSRLLQEYVQSRGDRNGRTRREDTSRCIQECLLRLHALPHDPEFIFRALELLVNCGDLYGATVLLVEGTMIRLYAVGQEGAANGYQQNILVTHSNEGYLRTVTTGLIHVYRDIRVDKDHLRIPVFSDERSAVFLPLGDNPGTIGALGLFRALPNHFENQEINDLVVLSQHLSMVLGHIVEQTDQLNSFQSSDLVLSAWEALTTVQSEQDLMNIFRELARKFCDATDTIVWLYGESGPLPPSTDRQSLSADTSVGAVFTGLLGVRSVRDIIDVANSELKPTILWARQVQHKPLEKLFEVMNAKHIAFVPLSDSGRLLGMVIVGFPSVNGQLQVLVDRLERLCLIAGRALERLTLVNSSLQRVNRLEATLAQVANGLILIGRDGKVDHVNVPIERLLGLSSTDLHRLHVTDVLRLMANQTANPEASFSRLHTGLDALTTDDHVEVGKLDVRTTDHGILVSFFAISQNDQNRRERGILVREEASLPMVDENDPVLSVKAFLEQNPLPYLKLREIANALIEDSDILNTGSARMRRLFVRSLDRELEFGNLMWNNLRALTQIEDADFTLDYESIDLNELIHLVLDRRLFRADYRRFRVTYLPASWNVQIDVNYLSHALVNCISYVLRETPSDKAVNIRLVEQHGGVSLTIAGEIAGNRGPSVQHPDYAHPSDDGRTASQSEYAIDVARKIIEKHGGQLTVTFQPQSDLIVIVDLALKPAEHSPSTEDEAQVEPFALSVPRRVIKQVALFEGRSLLVKTLRNLMELQGFDLIPFEAHEAGNLRHIRVGLVVIDTASDVEDPVDLYRRVRLYTEVPVVIVGDDFPAEKRTSALNLGVEDFIVSPITNEELGARINVLFNRVTIPDRVREPLRANDLLIDFSKRQVFLSRKLIELTRIEYELLQTLAINVGRILTHEQLLTQVWGPEFRDETQYLWVNIRRLRQKIERDPSKPIFVRTHPRTGYYFNPDT